MDTDKLIKLLMLTTSDSDGEANNAIRMANRLLKADGKNWQEFLSGRSSNNNRNEVMRLKMERDRLAADLVGARRQTEVARKKLESVQEEFHKLRIKVKQNNTESPPPPPQDDDPFGDSPYSKKERVRETFSGASIREMLDYCLEYIEGDGWNFIDSLNQGYTKWGSLTYAQARALEKFYMNQKKRESGW